MAEGIKQLGESLLADQRKRNDNIYKEGRKEAYKLGLMQAGVGLLNSSLKNRAINFMQSEQAMAGRAKQKRGYQDAQFFVTQQETIDNSGMNAVDYFTEQLLPSAKQLASESIREQDYDPDTYNTLIRQYTRELAQKKATEHASGFESASQIQTPEEFEKFQAMHATRMNTGFDWLASNVKAMFGGKTREELDQETLNLLSNSDMITKAETVTALRRSYSQLGSLDVAQKIAAAAEEGLIPEVERVVKYEMGTPLKSVGPWGGEVWHAPITAVYEDGSLVIGEDGNPRVIMHSLTGGEYSSGGRAPAQDRVINSLTDGEMQTASMALAGMIPSLTGVEADAFKVLQDKYAVGKDGKYDPTILATNIAGWGKAIGFNTGLEQPDAQKVAARVIINRAAHGYEDPAWGAPSLNFADLNFSTEPDAVEIAQALADLEGTGNAISYNSEQAMEMFSTLGRDFNSYDSEARDRFLSGVVSNPEKYPFLYEGVEGERIVDILAEIDAMEEMRQAVPQEAPPQTYEQPVSQGSRILDPAFAQFDKAKKWVTNLTSRRENQRLMVTANESITEMKSGENFKADADKYLTWLYGPGYKQDPVETLVDEINSPIIRETRSEDMPEDVAEAHQRMLNRINFTAKPTGWRETLTMLKDNQVDLFSSPETWLMAMGLIGGGQRAGVTIRTGAWNRTPPPEGQALPAPGAPAPRYTTPQSVGMARAEQQRSAAAARRWEDKMGQHIADTEFRSYLDPNRFVTKDDILTMIREEATRRKLPVRNMGPRQPSAGNEARLKVQEDARSYLKSIYNREPTNKEVLKYIKEVYGGSTVGQYNVRF
jgi:hypothetical protein